VTDTWQNRALQAQQCKLVLCNNLKKNANSNCCFMISFFTTKLTANQIEPKWNNLTKPTEIKNKANRAIKIYR
jgi:hypothetical protein